MQVHTKIYMDHFNCGIDDFMYCEVCYIEATWTERASDIHHIKGRGKGKNVIGNLMAVCRKCHNRCHNVEKPYISKEKQQEIHDEFLKIHP